MITNLDQLIGLTKTVSNFDERVYRGWPEAKPESPFAIVTTVANVTNYQYDQEEIIADLTYQVDIFADDPAEAEDLASDVSNLFNRYGIIRSGYFDGFEPSEGLRRVTINFRVSLDKRGNTY
ncbi:MAG: hypothetical protein IJT54_03925 [Candidatus Methanomethylophilaceae archaeon]|nr:hypothetical protein [Candidatus Methanomethylophilaceae archaeon]